MSDMSLFEAMYNCRAIRYLLPDPVPDEIIHKLLDAAIRAPSGSNRQSWHFLVVKDPAVKKPIQERYKQAFDAYASMMADVPPRPGVSEETMERVKSSAAHLAEHLHEAPVYIIPLLVSEQGKIRGDGPFQDLGRKSLYSSVYPAVQNILLAARALGLDCGPMSGFDNARVDAEFFPDGQLKSNFLCNLGKGDASKLPPLNPRFEFDEVCKII